MSARPIVLPHHVRREIARHEGRHAAGSLTFGLPVLTASIDLGEEPGSDRHGEVTSASERMNLNDPLQQRQAIVVNLLGYVGADPRFDLPDGREASAWPPPTLRDAQDEGLEDIALLSRAWIESEEDWQLVLGWTRSVAADPRFQALTEEIAQALLDKQTLLPDDLARIASPALDRAMGDHEVQP
jgi:hypothetical protein